MKNKSTDNLEPIDNVIESLLFLSGNAMKFETIMEGLDINKSELKKSVARLKEKYSGKNGIHLIEYNNKLQFGTNPDYAEQVEKILNPIKEKELSRAMLETVAIIAYRQPVTKLEIENMRGVNCDYTMQTLLSLNLIEAVGVKEAIGHPKLYGTTEEFLKRFQLKSIDALPDYEDLMKKVEELQKAQLSEPTEQPTEASLYNEFEIPDEKPDFVDESEAMTVEVNPEAAATTDEEANS